MEYYTREEVDKLIEQAIGTAVERALISLPMTVKHLVTMFSGLKSMGDKFLEDNKDIAQHKDLIRATMEKLEGEHPNWTYDRMLEETARRVRNIIAKSGSVNNTDVNKKSREEIDENISNILGG